MGKNPKGFEKKTNTKSNKTNDKIVPAYEQKKFCSTVHPLDFIHKVKMSGPSLSAIITCFDVMHTLFGMAGEMKLGRRAEI